MSHLLLLLTIMLAVPCFCSAQPAKEPDFDRLIESVFSIQKDDINYSDLYESFLHFYQNPLNINTCSREELQSLFILADEQIIQLLDYRDEYGDFFSLYELFHVEKLDSNKVQLLIPFLTVEYSGRWKGDTIPIHKRMIRYSRNSLILRYSRLAEPKKGLLNRRIPDAVYNGKYFLGSGHYNYGRFHMKLPGDFKLGFTVEKDPGEVFYFKFGSGSYGFDHLAGYLQVSNRGIIKNLVLGNFQFHAGQGLVAGSGFFTGKGNETVSTIRRVDRGIIPYQGSSENDFFRGIGFTLGGLKLEFSGFFSHKFEDGIIDYDDEGTLVIRSFLKTGYHRTPLEFSRKNNISGITYGSRLRYRSKYRNFSAGLVTVKNHFKIPIREKDYLYNRFDVKGRDHLVSGVYYNYYQGKFNIFGEASITGEGGTGFVQGLIANLSPELETSFHLRGFDVKYFSFYGSTFGDSRINRNEYGLYWGIKLIPFKKFEINAFFDVYKRKWLSSRVFAPHMGYEWMGRMSWQFSDDQQAEIVYREDHSAKNQSRNYISAGNDTGTKAGGNQFIGENGDAGLAGENIRSNREIFPEYTVIDQVRKRFRIAYTLEQRDGFYFKTRCQISIHRSESLSSGLAIAQDAGYSRGKYSMRGRIAFFTTGSYDTRQYMYEHDVLYYFSIPLYYGKGIRYYLMVKYALNEDINIWVKGGRFHYFDREGTGSGLDYIDGNKKTEIRCQVQLKF